MILNIWMMYRSSKSTIHYIGRYGILCYHTNNNGKYWMNSNEMIDVDLPSLQSIQLGNEALYGKMRDKSCSLKMRSHIWYDSKWLNVDLPKLTSILNSGGHSFYCYGSVTLESELFQWCKLHSDIPILQNVDLPHSFKRVQSK